MDQFKQIKKKRIFLIDKSTINTTLLIKKILKTENNKIIYDVRKINKKIQIYYQIYYQKAFSNNSQIKQKYSFEDKKKITKKQVIEASYIIKEIKASSWDFLK